MCKLSNELRQWATGPMSRNPEHTDACELLLRASEEIELLQAVMDAAERFLAVPTPDMKDSYPFSQYTTAGDCRALNKAYDAAVKAEAARDD